MKVIYQFGDPTPNRPILDPYIPKDPKRDPNSNPEDDDDEFNNDNDHRHPDIDDDNDDDEDRY